MAKNDWIVAGLNNPDFTNSDFSNIAEMTIDNTQLLSRDEYLKSDYIKNNPAFKDNNGNFSETKFTEYYKKRVQDFGDFQEQEISQGPALDMFDIDRTSKTPIQDIHFDIKRGVNPDRQAIGIEGVNVWSDPVFSKREIAKQNKVYNTETGKYEDYTVNEHTLVSNPIEWIKDQFRDPLVLATYDEDGTHVDPITGIVQQHKKGDAKLNDKGTYYYETLGGRSVLGKEVLSVFDTFTVDGQGINKYDFFDSNDIEKSVSGTIAKNVAAVLPLFCGPVVGGIYAAALIGREFSKSLPMLYGMATALTDSETPSWINNLAAYGTRFSTSTSDYAQGNTFSFENFGNLVSDVALQWGQQKAIASVFNKMRGAPNYIEEANKNAKALYDAKRATLGDSKELWEVCQNRFLPAAQKKAELASQLGRDMSLAYMAIVSNTDVYADALEHGTTKKEAAAIALGSTLGMFAFDKYSKLGEIFFDDATGDATKAARQALRNEFRQAREAFSGIHSSEAPARNKFMQFIAKGAETSKRVLSKFNEDLKYHSLGMAGKMVGEGLEEVGEEFIADVSKSMYELAGEFGFNTSTKDVGAWDNAFDRYAMSFLGGAVGGGVFYGKEVWDKGTFHKPKLDEDIATLIRNGHVDELRKQLAIMNKEGKTGDKHLSATDYEVTSDNKTVWKTTEDEAASQSQAVMNLVNDRINSIEEIIIGNRANLSDDELFDNMVLSEKRYNRYKNIAQLTNYYQDFASVLNRVVNDEMAYRHAADTMEGTADGTKIPNDTALAHLTDQQKQQRQANLDALQQKVQGSKTALQNFLAGETSLDYTRKLNFAMDAALHTPFLEVDMDSYLQTLYSGKTLSQLTPEESIKFLTQQWPEYVQTQLKTKLSTAWEKFKSLEATVNPHLETLSQDTPAYKTWVSNMEALFSSGVLNTDKLQQSYKGINDKLDTESDDEFNNRDTKIINPLTGEIETDSEFNLRRFNRHKAIKDYNEQLDKQWADAVEAELQKVGYKVDPQTARFLRRIIPASGRLKAVIDRTVNFGTLNPMLRSVLKTLNPDLSNAQELSDTVRNTITTDTKASVNKLFSAFQDFTVKDNTGAEMSMVDFLQSDPNLDGLTVQDLIDDFENSDADPDYEGYLSDLEESNREALRTVLYDLVNTQLQGVEDLELSNIADGIITADYFDTEVTAMVDQKFTPLQNTINSIVSDIQNNALFKLQSRLQTSIVNPVGELLKQIATSNNDTLPEIDTILQTIQDDYEGIDDIHQLQLNDAQRENLEKARNYMNLLKVYMTAASTLPTTNTPIGHNRTINAFAESHADRLRTPWTKLPEIEADYATLYQQALDSYTEEIDNWIQLSDSNSINKIARFARTDKALSNSLWDVLSKLSRDFNFNGKTLDVLEGIDTIDKAQLDSNLAQVPLYSLERLIYKNVHQFAADNNITVSDLIKNSNLLETLITGLKQLNNQKSSAVTDTLTSDSFTDFDKLQYIATILSTDPTEFYQALNQRVSTNNQIAPVAVQELSARIAQASMTQTFRDILAHARSLADNQETPMLTNTTIVFGVAGAGKTQVILNSIDSAIKGEEVFIAGPTQEQALAMQKAMGRSNSTTFEDLLITILGKDQWDRIKAEFDKYNTDEAFDGTYFSTARGSDGLMKLRLKPSAIQFNQVAKAPKAIYMDEATHLTTLQAQIIDAYAASVGAQVFMCGDPAQLGYNNPNNSVQNIDEGAVFAARTPKLTISLRDNNLQKFQNQEAVRSLLEQVLDKRLYATETEYEAFFPTVQNLFSKFNFRVYNDTELNGDMITGQLDDGTIAKLKAGVANQKTIAFIGNPSSAHLAKLQAAGIDIPKNHILNLATMQGQEFDYVVIDEKFTMPTNIAEGREFLQRLYTLMTRAREASVFIDNGLSQIIGKNLISRNKSKAPSIRSGVTQLIDQKLEILKQLDYNPIVINNPAAQQTQTGPQPTPQPTPTVVNTEEDFNDPDQRADTKATDMIQDLANEDTASVDDTTPVNMDAQTALDYFPIECYGDTTYLSAFVENDVEMFTKKGEKKKGTKWTVPVVADGELRNLQALLTEDEEKAGGAEAFWYKDKIALQRRIYEVKSALLFQHSWPTATNPKSLPVTITRNFNKTDWENGTYELEFRTPTDQDVIPLHGNFREAGFEYNGQRIIADIIFKVKDKRGRVCKFDLAGINNPRTLIDGKATLKDSLNAVINNPNTDDSTRQKLQNMVASVDSAALAYQNWFEERMLEFARTGRLSIDVSNAIRHTQTTWFKKRTGKPIRLGGTINPDNINKSDINSLIGQNPDKVFSQVYTFSNNEADFYNLDPSLRGKAVIFVTDDILMEPSELISTYLAQKRNPQDNTPKVRMIVLDNYGMSFSQLNDTEYIKAFQQGNEERKPFRQNFTGIRMFTSMWNTRASLIKFLDAYNSWKTNNNLNDAQIKALMRAQNMAYNGDSEEKIQPVLQNAGLTKESLSLLDEFNNEICKDIPMFRLGYNTNANGFHIQRYNVKDSIAYKGKDEANLCAITPEKAIQFLGMLRAVIQPICPSTTSGTYGAKNSLDVRLTKPGPNGTTVEWAEDELIDLEQADHKRTLSGLLKVEGGTLKVETTDADGNTQTLAYAEGEAWSIIPSLVSRIVRTVAHFQHEPDQATNRAELVARLAYPKNAGHGQITEKVSIEIDISAFFGPEGLLAPTPENGKTDHSLFDMFNLMFHGTTEDIHRPVGDGKTQYTNPDGTKEVRYPLMQLDDAYFKKGFLINPDISRKSDGADATDIVGHRGHNDKLIFFEIATNPALFTADVDLRSAGLQLMLNEVINPTRQQAEPETQEQGLPTQEELFKQNHPMIVSAIDLLNSMNKTDDMGNPFTYSEDMIEDAIDAYNQITMDGFKSVLVASTPQDALNQIYMIDSNEQPLSYGQYLAKQYPGAKIGTEGDNITIETQDGKLYRIDKQTVKPVLISETTPTTQSVSRLDGKYQDTTVGQALLALLNTPEFKELAIECGATDEILNSFMQEMNKAIQLGQTLTDSEDPLMDRLNEIMNTDGNETVLEALSTQNEDLYNIIFENC